MADSSGTLTAKGCTVFKAMFFLYGQPDHNREELRRYTQEIHIPLASKVPGLERYVVNYTLMNPAGAEGACDAVAELWFASGEDFQAALASPEGVAAVADLANYLDMSRTHALVMEEHTVR
jgi:uncharacterized protein (TIGR02118 family)